MCLVCVIHECECVRVLCTHVCVHYTHIQKYTANLAENIFIERIYCFLVVIFIILLCFLPVSVFCIVSVAVYSAVYAYLRGIYITKLYLFNSY